MVAWVWVCKCACLSPCPAALSRSPHSFSPSSMHQLSASERTSDIRPVLQNRERARARAREGERKRARSRERDRDGIHCIYGYMYAYMHTHTQTHTHTKGTRPVLSRAGRRLKVPRPLGGRAVVDRCANGGPTDLRGAFLGELVPGSLLPLTLGYPNSCQAAHSYHSTRRAQSKVPWQPNTRPCNTSLLQSCQDAHSYHSTRRALAAEESAGARARGQVREGGRARRQVFGCRGWASRVRGCGVLCDGGGAGP